MDFRVTRIASLILPVILLVAATATAEPFPPIARRLPPQGIVIPPEVKSELTERVAGIRARLAKLPKDFADKPDIEIYAKAIDLALHFGEFYNAKHFDVARSALATANQRLDEIEKHGAGSWQSARGLIVRGYRSRIDQSAQPYGLEIAEGIDLKNPAPLVVWLHGRGDQQTDLHFIQERANKKGQFQIPGAIVVHPFGRHCLGFKSAGEIDVLDAIEAVCDNYSVDRDRIVLAGFSMGGAGAWHLGAHYAERWCVVAPGAGFAETRRYQNLDPAKVAWYERKLWGNYDVPDYARNLLNVPLIAYSGEADKQKQAADVMAEALLKEGHMLRHLIGPKTGHAYEPATLKQLLAEVGKLVAKGREKMPRKVSLQTRTLRYSSQDWVQVEGLEEHWRDSRVDAELKDDGSVIATTKNISALKLLLEGKSDWAVMIDGDKLVLPQQMETPLAPCFVKEAGHWKVHTREAVGATELKKIPGCQGPIDDAFLSQFVVVRPTGKSRNPAVQAWVEAEYARFHERWRGVFRGAIEEEDNSRDPFQRQCNYVVWGDPESNPHLAWLNDVGNQKANRPLPIRWQRNEIVIDGRERFPAASHVPVMIYPHPRFPQYYVVVNSGPTFREAHDGTNSQQNPKLPDWAIVDLSTPPSDKLPGRIAAAGFFDEAWRVKRNESEE